MGSDNEWKNKVIKKDIIASMKKLGKKTDKIVLLYKIKSLEASQLPRPKGCSLSVMMR